MCSLFVHTVRRHNGIDEATAHCTLSISAAIDRKHKEGIGSTDTKPSKHTIESTTGAKSVQ